MRRAGWDPGGERGAWAPSEKHAIAIRADRVTPTQVSRDLSASCDCLINSSNSSRLRTMFPEARVGPCLPRAHGYRERSCRPTPKASCGGCRTPLHCLSFRNGIGKCPLGHWGQWSPPDAWGVQEGGLGPGGPRDPHNPAGCVKVVTRAWEGVQGGSLQAVRSVAGLHEQTESWGPVALGQPAQPRKFSV